MSKHFVFNLCLLKKLSLSLFLSSVAELAQADILTVDNRPGRAADFDNLQAAVDAAISGDTIYVIGSEFSYGNVTVSTPNLTLFGPGYLLEQNEIATTNLESAQINEFIVTSAADGLTVVGMVLGSDNNGNFVTSILADGVTFRRVFFDNDIFLSTSSFVADSTSFIQCIIGDDSNDDLDVSANNAGDLATTNLLIRNCIIQDIVMDNGSEAVIDQCVFVEQAVLENAQVRNSVFVVAPFLNAGNDVQFSIAPGANDLPTTNNLNGVNLATVFYGFTTVPTGLPTLDQQWSLIPGSPALAAGDQGQDIGIFAGSTAYILSGVAPLPSISSVTAPPLVIQGSDLTIQIEATANP